LGRVKVVCVAVEQGGYRRAGADHVVDGAFHRVRTQVVESHVANGRGEAAAPVVYIRPVGVDVVGGIRAAPNNGLGR